MKLTPAQRVGSTVRLNLRQAESTRAKIRISNLVTRMEKFAMGESERCSTGEMKLVTMTPLQFEAAKFLLSLRIPALSRVEHVGLDGGPIQTQEIPATPDEASRAYMDMLNAPKAPSAPAPTQH